MGGVYSEVEYQKEGKKHDSGKLRYDLVPVDAQREVVRVLTFGAQKYGDNNWRITEPKSRYIAAAFRHIEAFRSGETVDAESGIHPLAHAICSLLFVLQMQVEKPNSNAILGVNEDGNA